MVAMLLAIESGIVDTMKRIWHFKQLERTASKAGVALMACPRYAPAVSSCILKPLGRNFGDAQSRRGRWPMLLSMAPIKEWLAAKQRPNAGNKAQR